ncbi:MAG: M48 family metallopeptidase [Clostridia bacterium]|nr:M48 family metallopeptidase [Clostridia bacterium]
MDFKILVLIFVALSTAYNIALNIIRYRSANNPTPQSVSDVYDAETYQKWKEYSAEHCRFDIISGAVSGVISLILLATNVYSAFANLFPSDNIHLQLLAVIILEVTINTVLGSIFSYVKVMIIEEKYGFNRSSKKTFVFDQIRSLIVSLMLCVALAEAMTLLEISKWLVIAFGAIVFCGMLLISFIYPSLSRIGNKFPPLEDGELKERLLEMLSRHGYSVKAIEVMDASRRTTKLNAYIAGFGKTKSIVLYDNMLEKMSTDEICAIFAHEMGHGLHKDVLKGQFFNIGYITLISALVYIAVAVPEFYTQFGFESVNYGFAYLLVSAGLGVLQPLTSMAMNAHSRAAEYAADRQAVIEGYGKPMITAFKKLAKDNFANLSPSKINVVLEYSHPPIHSRVEAVEKAMAELAQSRENR